MEISLTAIDILINPDQTMLTHAKSWNARLLKSVPPPVGFELDEHHQPHITTLQRYVHTADLDKVFAAIEGVISSTDVGGFTFSGEKILHMEEKSLAGKGLAAIVCQAPPDFLDYQARLINAIAPYTASEGTSEAYVRTEAEPDINEDTLTYVKNYDPDHSEKNFMAHVTIGLATLKDLEEIEAEHFESFDFSQSAVSVYQLGNNGTASKLLNRFEL